MKSLKNLLINPVYSLYLLILKILLKSYGYRLNKHDTLSKKDSATYLNRRKLLLDEIRKEYKKISRENSEKNIKKK